MCKLMIIPSIKVDKQELAWTLAQTITPHLVSHDRDGFGYMSLTDKGLSGERWLNVDHAWIMRDAEKQVQDLLGPAADASLSYSAFGRQGKTLHSLALHSRMATCGVDMSNTHPHVSPDLSVGIVHNGVISNATDFGLKYSTCDSEAFLSIYTDKAYSLNESLEPMFEASEILSGWYAAAAFHKLKNGTWAVDVFRDNRAPLYAAYVTEIDAVVMVTKMEHLEAALEELAWAPVTFSKMRDRSAVRIDPLTGKLMQYQALSDCVLHKTVKAPAELPNYHRGWNDRYGYEHDDDAPSYREDYKQHEDKDAIASALLNNDKPWRKKVG